MNNIYLIVFALVTVNTSGQLLLKMATINRKYSYVLLAIGYSLFLLTIVVSYYLMKYIDLKYFTVVMSLNYISVLLTSIYFFKEKLTKLKVIGTLTVVVGIYIFTGGYKI